MTKVRNLFLWWSIQKIEQKRSRSDSLSFQSFYNEGSSEMQKSAIEESSLTNKKISYKIVDANTYQQFSQKDERSKCVWPSFSTVLCIFLACVMIILPIIYLLQCLGIINVDRQVQISYAFKKKIYEPISEDHLFNGLKEDNVFLTDAPDFPELSLPHPPEADHCSSVNVNDKFDCYPEPGCNKQGCEQRGCCWIPTDSQPENNNFQSPFPPLNTPYCFFPDNYQSYVYINITQTSSGVVAFLKRVFKSPFPQDVNIVKLTVNYDTDTCLHVKITDPFRNRYEPRFPEIPIVNKAATNLTYNFVVNPTKTGFKIVRKVDGTVIFDSQGIESFIFADQYLQITTKLPSKFIYGLGEHRSHLLLSTNWQRFVLFNHDSIPTENRNLYGSHPFYLVMENSGKSHGVFLLNSNAIEIILQPTPALTFRALGGVLDLYFFTGPLPSDVIKQYTEVIGRPFMPPYWGLGFHFCRFGFKTLNETRKVWKRIVDSGIPFDTQWNDLDYMKNSNDFTLDEENFGELPDFVKELHDQGMHYIPLIDPGISGSEPPGTYPPFDVGLKMDIFVKNSSGKPFIGKVWNKGTTVWPDFTSSKTVEYWIQMLKTMHNIFPFDGAWIDMNEPSNFLSGSIYGCPNNNLETPPYTPLIDGNQLNYKTMCMSSEHFEGKHYDLHNVFGLFESVITNEAMAEIRRKRPMIISRSTFAGSGHYVGHWSGDVVSNWYDMKYTVPELLSFSMFGIPLMGADICGFNGNTTASLCNRWMQLGAFYPFSRNHNTDDGIDQDPVALGPQVVESSKKALRVRYSLLPYLYTLFWAAHTQGSTVATPMFFEFPNDVNTYALEEQFLWGPAVLIVPVLQENKETVSAYLPAGIWYDFYSGKPLTSKGQTVELSAPLDTIPVLIRGGYVLPQQEPLNTTTASRKTKVELLVAPDEMGKGQGQFYWDDGDSLDSVTSKIYSLISFDLKPGFLTTKPEWWGPENPPNLGKITVLGISTPITKVLVNSIERSFKYNTTGQYFVVNQMNESFKSNILISWI